MSDQEPLFDCEDANGVTIVRILVKDLRQPFQAAELGEQLVALITAGHTKLLINFEELGYMGSTGFAMLMVLARKLKERGGQLRFCRMQEEVRFGANILGLGSVVPIYEDEDAALKDF
jgi:anti-anti-sigma factor